MGRLGWQNGHAFEAEFPEPFAAAVGTAPSEVLAEQSSLF
jgi:hypothetical protein